MQVHQTNEDLLSMEDYYERASAGKRFVNYLIDVLLFYVIVLVLGFLLVIMFPAFGDFLNNDSPGFTLLDRLFSLILYALYMSATEALFKGKTLGKFITKTRAVNLDGSEISTGSAFARGFSRAVPFAVFSAFGNPSNPWQDKWTNTMVVNEKH